MNAAAERKDIRAALFAEIAELKRQRDDCMRQLAACRQQNRELRDRINELRWGC